MVYSSPRQPSFRIFNLKVKVKSKILVSQFCNAQQTGRGGSVCGSEGRVGLHRGLGDFQQVRIRKYLPRLCRGVFPPDPQYWIQKWFVCLIFPSFSGPSCTYQRWITSRAVWRARAQAVGVGLGLMGCLSPHHTIALHACHHLVNVLV